MKKDKNVQLVIITVMAIILAGMSIGFAAFTQSLTITGTANVDPSQWSVKIVDSSSDYPETDVSHSFTGTTGSFAMTLTAPGDSKNVRFDIENNGTIDAKLTNISVSGVDDEQWEYLEILAEIKLNDEETIYFGGDVEDWNDYIDNNPFDAGDEGYIELEVKYVTPDLPTDLPEYNQYVNLTVTLNFAQK